MFVMDLSGGAGDKCSSVVDQLILWREVMALFPRRPWVDVVSSGFGDCGWSRGTIDEYFGGGEVGKVEADFFCRWCFDLQSVDRL
jgi:hypothetical protein